MAGRELNLRLRDADNAGEVQAQVERRPRVRAAIYCRISDDRTGEAAGVARQQVDCGAFVAKHGWTLVKVFVDNDVSASKYSRKRRPQYTAMLDLVRRGEVDVIVAYHVDRLYRRPRELEDLIDLRGPDGQAIQIRTLHGDLDLNTDAGKLVARMLVAVAAAEADNTSRRMITWHQARREDRRPPGGHRVFGLQADGVTPDPEEAPLLRTAAVRILAGGTLRGQCAEWNEAEVKTTLGNRWSRMTLRRLLQNPRIRPILGDEVFEAVQAVLAVPAKQLPGAGTSKYLLTGGLAHCGLCGNRIQSRPRRKGNRGYGSYACIKGVENTGCGKIHRAAAPVDRYIEAELLLALEASGRKPWDEDPEAARLAAVAAKYTARLATLKTEYSVEGMWTKDEYLVNRAQLEARLVDVQCDLAARPGLGSLQTRPLDDEWDESVSPWRTWWDGADRDERQGLIRREVVSIKVYPPGKGAQRFDPATVEIELSEALLALIPDDEFGFSDVQQISA